MEGRIDRDSLSPKPPATHDNDVKRSAPGYTSYSRHHRTRSTLGARRRRYKNAQRELIPEGKDLMVVQLLASGILLLFVMFISLVPSAQTESVRERLKKAFSETTSVEQATQSLEVIKNTITQAADNSAEQADDQYIPPDAVEADLPIATTNEENAVDPELLKQINEAANPQKN